MKSRTILCLGIGTLLTLNSCYTWQPPGPPPPPRRGASLDSPPREPTRYMDGPDLGPVPSDGPIPGEIQPPQPQNPTTSPSDVPAPITPSEPTPPPAPAPKPPGANSNLPFGIKVPNKPGFVYSPYDKTAGIVDVTGFATGTKVKCPYTSKVFLVP